LLDDISAFVFSKSKLSLFFQSVKHQDGFIAVLDQIILLLQVFRAFLRTLNLAAILVALLVALT
jgi:hypothetical protein